jgi:hypothetical protein
MNQKARNKKANTNAFSLSITKNKLDVCTDRERFPTRNEFEMALDGFLANHDRMDFQGTQQTVNDAHQMDVLLVLRRCLLGPGIMITIKNRKSRANLEGYVD